MPFRDWIQRGRELGASDLHVESGIPLVARVSGELVSGGEPISAAQVSNAARELLGAEGWNQFLARGSADVAIAASGARCRVSLFRTVRGVALAVRLLTPVTSDLRACNLHPDLRRLIEATAGLVVISGPTGCGKSTTLAALIEEINGSRSRNIITLESPLEYLFTNRRSFIRQREIPSHSPSFEQAIIDALRENPDVLVIGEMRTPEVIRLTLNAAETGHLVLATMHSASCAEALSRICMSFPAEIQGSIRAQLADCLVGVVCQRLEPLGSQPERIGDAAKFRVPRCEVLLASSSAKGTIRAGQLSQIPNVILSGGEEGMWTFDRYQRWVEQKTDWLRPNVAPALDREAARIHASRGGPPSSRVAAPSKPAPSPGAAGSASEAPSGSADSPGEITIDEDLDPAELAELARKIEERTR
ncbi:MAG TPA: ATPase, T2SS/T4P/T4SS family [Steroidobacteraceae bacterium]|nr:ATPase, T2SS/T4P/T4SS family [Steroidobacteraceae bacterium]